MKCFARLSLLALGLGLPLSATAEIAWRESYYNPQPAAGDLILPMPCAARSPSSVPMSCNRRAYRRKLA